MSKMPKNYSYNFPEEEFVMFPDAEGGVVSLPLLSVLKLYNALAARSSRSGLELLVEDHRAYENDSESEAEGYFVWCDIEEVRPAVPHLTSVNTH